MSVSSLRSHLLTALRSLAGSRVLHLHVLVSTSRKPNQSLFLYAATRPKCFVQDILILLSEETTEHSPQNSSSSCTGASTHSSPRVFVSAIEASVYAFPASASTILYVSKVDGTGQGIYPSPTSTLLSAFLVFYASMKSPLYARPTPPHHLWIHLFARSQRQYLFPNSADHPNKKPLGDIALCKWWKTVLTNVAKVVETKDNVDDRTAVPNELTHPVRLYYILPGHTEMEASHLLRETQDSPMPSQVHWIYSHPYNFYDEIEIPFPSAPSPEHDAKLGPIPLAYLIPHFEDDPKSRFLDELAATSEEQAVAIPTPTPRRKRQRIEGDKEASTTLEESVQNVGSNVMKDEKEKGSGTSAERESCVQPPTIMYIPPSSSPRQPGSPSPPLRPSTPEPKEFSQHAALSPHTPHLPTLPSLLSSHTPPPHVHRTTSSTLQTPTPQVMPRIPRTPRTPRRTKSDLDTISPVEFWERMSFRQECAVGAVTGFFVAVFSRKFKGGWTNTDAIFSSNTTYGGANADILSTLMSTGTIPHSIVKRVMSSLLTGVEFSTVERARKGTNVIETAIKGLCQGLDQGDPSRDDDPRTDEVTADSDTDNASRNIYTSHVYASLSITNPPPARKSVDRANVTPTVNVLGVRRKKKREGA